MENICGLNAEQVAKIPTATNSTTFFLASKDFLTTYLFHNGEDDKEMLKGKEQ